MNVFPEVSDPWEGPLTKGSSEHPCRLRLWVGQCAGEVKFVGSLSRLARGNKWAGSSFVRQNGNERVLCLCRVNKES